MNDPIPPSPLSVFWCGITIRHHAHPHPPFYGYLTIIYNKTSVSNCDHNIVISHPKTNKQISAKKEELQVIASTIYYFLCHCTTPTKYCA